MLSSNACASKLDINHLSFNQDGGCFAIGTNSGYRIFNCDPLKQLLDDDIDGGIRIAEMLFRCNYVALVGMGSNEKFPRNKVIIWDSLKKQVIADVEVCSHVRGVKLRRDRICIVMDEYVSIYTFGDTPRHLHTIETWTNPRGIIVLTPSIDNPLLAFPSRSGIGAVDIINLALPNNEALTIKAHTHEISAINFNHDGTLLASASEKGTLVRIYEPENGNLLREFRRGSQQAQIYCITFSIDSSLLAVASNHSTIHIFSLISEREKSNVSSSVKRYFKGDVSFARFKITPMSSSRTVLVSKCAFDVNSESIIAICNDGSYHRFSYDRHSGKCTKQLCCLFSELTN